MPGPVLAGAEPALLHPLDHDRRRHFRLHGQIEIGDQLAAKAELPVRPLIILPPGELDVAAPVRRVIFGEMGFAPRFAQPEGLADGLHRRRRFVKGRRQRVGGEGKRPFGRGRGGKNGFEPGFLVGLQSGGKERGRLDRREEFGRIRQADSARGRGPAGQRMLVGRMTLPWPPPRPPALRADRAGRRRPSLRSAVNPLPRALRIAVKMGLRIGAPFLESRLEATGGDYEIDGSDDQSVSDPNRGSLQEWSGRRESNPRRKLGKLLLCH